VSSGNSDPTNSGNAGHSGSPPDDPGPSITPMSNRGEARNARHGQKTRSPGPATRTLFVTAAELTDLERLRSAWHGLPGSEDVARAAGRQREAPSAPVRGAVPLDGRPDGADRRATCGRCSLRLASASTCSPATTARARLVLQDPGESRAQRSAISGKSRSGMPTMRYVTLPLLISIEDLSVASHDNQLADTLVRYVAAHVLS
jgi:hypothetical protein